MALSKPVVACLALNAALLLSLVATRVVPRANLQAGLATRSNLGRLSTTQARNVQANAAYGYGGGSKNCLILQNKGGGHGEIGFHLAHQLADKGHKVTIIGDPKTKQDQLPFSKYGFLADKGVKIAFADPCDPSTYANLGAFDAVFDNISKSKDSCKTAADAAKSWGVSNYVYVSSAGMYKPGNTFPMTENLPVKDSAGQKEVEDYLNQIGLPWSSFRPQYIYGPLTNKRDYLDYFFDRITRGRPIPVAGTGQQLVTLTHAGDVASMMASVLEAGDKAHRQVFNCATDQLITVDTLIDLCANIAGVPAPPIVHYNPKKVTLDKKAFPFRDSHFFVAPEKAKTVLGWKCAYDLENELRGYFQGYIGGRKHERQINFEIDDMVLRQVPMMA